MFQIIEKLPSKYKKIKFYIDPKNEFFLNKWWLKLVLDKAENKQVEVIFVIENIKQEQLMKAMWAKYEWKKIPIYKKIYQSFLDFLSLFKSENSFYKRHYNIIKILLLFLEIWFLVFIIYFIYNLVTPKTDVYIQPAVNIKHLVKKIYIYPKWEKLSYNIKKKDYLMYKTDIFSKTESLKIPVSDILYDQKPAQWKIKFINYLWNGFSLKAHTLMVTDDGLLYRLKNWVYVPPHDGKWNPWIAYAIVVAEPKDENGKIIWDRWNITKWTQLFIKKMYVSFGKRMVYAEVNKNFEWWKTISKWEVSLEDIEYIKKQLLEKFKANLRKNISKYIQLKWNNQIFLSKEWLYGFKDVKYYILSKVWDKTPYIKWNIEAKIYFSYLNKEELKKIMKRYIWERLVSENDFLWFDDNSIEILNLENVTKNLYVMVLSINALLGYDFELDYNYILPRIKDEIKWRTINYAKNKLLSYPYIAWVEIKNSSWLKTISKLKSRIFIHITK